MRVASFGSGVVPVVFAFSPPFRATLPSAPLFCSVWCFCSSRSAAARLLWRFRAARRWWRSSAAPPRSSVLRLTCCPRFGLRWLAARACLVSVRLPRPGRPFWRCLVPSARVGGWWVPPSSVLWALRG